MDQDFRFKSFFPFNRARFEWEQKEEVVRTFKRVILNNQILKQKVQESYLAGENGFSLCGATDGSGVDLDVTFFKGRESKFFIKLCKSGRAELSEQKKSERKEMGHFFDELSHEIRNSLQIIVGSSELLQADEEKTKDELLKNIHDSARHLKSLLNNYLLERKNGHHQVGEIAEIFDLKSMLMSLKHQHELSANHKGLKLVFKVDSSIPACVKGDPVKLTQILNNLLGNAIYYTHQGMVTVTALVTQVKSGKVKISFSVQDTGKGIAPENQSKLFDLFEQIDPTEESRGTHFGLGMAITKKLIHCMGSEVNLDSELGKGTCFSFELELGVEESIRPKNQKEGKANCQTDIKEINQFKALNKVKVLAVDDCPINRMVMEKQLKTLGVNCHTAASGVEAYHLIYHNRYPLIMLDNKLPDLSGLALARIIRREFPGTHVVLVSGEDFALSSEELNELGIQSKLAKPYTAQELQELLMPEMLLGMESHF